MHLQKVHKLNCILIFRDFNLFSRCFKIIGLGYTITLIYLWVQNPELAIQRVRDRVASGGHNIQEDVLRRRYGVGLKYLFDIYMPLCDRWMIGDNTNPPFSLVAEGNSKRTIIKDEDKFKRIRKLVESDEEQH